MDADERYRQDEEARRMTNLARIATVGLLVMTLMGGASAAKKEEPCFIKDGAAKQGALVAPSPWALKDAQSIMGSGDVKAWDRLLASKRAVLVPAGTRVFVEEKGEGVLYRIRLEGMIDSVWVHGFYLTCVKP